MAIDLKKLEESVNSNLRTFDIYEQPVEFEDIEPIRNFFTIERHYIVKITASSSDNSQLKNLNYRATFQNLS